MRILISRDVSDYKFVAEAIRQHRLSPRVSEAPVTTTNGPVKKVVEKYEWGRVIFSYLNDGASGSTIVVVDEGSKVTDIPGCLGLVVDEDHQDAGECYGNPKASKGSRESQPCSWLSKCQAIKTAAEKHGLSPDQVLLRCSIEQIEAGNVGKRNTDGVMAKPFAKRGSRISTVEAEALLRDAANAFFEEVAKKLDRPVAQVSNHKGDAGSRSKELKNGQLYIRDRLSNSRYIGLYAFSSDGRDFPIIVLYPVPRNMAFHVHLPLSSKDLKKVDPDGIVAKLNPRDIEFGRLRSVSKKVDRELLGKAVSLVERMCAKQYELPDLEK
jgi:hypothetical protein